MLKTPKGHKLNETVESASTCGSPRVYDGEMQEPSDFHFWHIEEDLAHTAIV